MEEAPTEPTAVGSRIGSEEIWRLARADFQRGDSAAVVCERYDLGKSTFWARAAVEGWRRADAASQETPQALLPDTDEMDAIDLAAMARARLGFALAAGKPAEATSWMRLYQSLRQVGREDDLF